MDPSAAAHRRSGDPRKRAAAASSSQRRIGRWWPLAAALAAAVPLVWLAAVSVRPDGSDATAAGTRPNATAAVHAQTLMHGEVACDLLRRAEQAADDSEAKARVRYAAAVLLLDQALVESGRAARSDIRLTELDAALQAVHVAGHEGDRDQWQGALLDAHTACHSLPGDG